MICTSWWASVVSVGSQSLEKNCHLQFVDALGFDTEDRLIDAYTWCKDIRLLNTIFEGSVKFFIRHDVSKTPEHSLESERRGEWWREREREKNHFSININFSPHSPAQHWPVRPTAVARHNCEHSVHPRSSWAAPPECPGLYQLPASLGFPPPSAWTGTTTSTCNPSNLWPLVRSTKRN